MEARVNTTMNVSMEEAKRCEETASEFAITRSEAKKKIKKPDFPWNSFKLFSLSLIVALIFLSLSLRANSSEKDSLKSILFLVFSIIFFLFTLYFSMTQILPHLIPRLRRFSILQETI